MSLAKNSPSTLVALLLQQAQCQPDRRAITLLADGVTEVNHLTYEALDRKAKAISVYLQAQGAQGERALLVFPPAPEFCSGGFGCLYAGVVAVSTYPPDPSRLPETLPTFLRVAKNSRAKFALTTRVILAMIQPLLAMAPELKDIQWISIDDVPDDLAKDWKARDISPDTLAYLQYTSGSTGDPKGVMFSHRNVIYQLEQAKEIYGTSPESVFVNWAPFYHNFGVGVFLHSVFAGASFFYLSPLSFLQNPISWLQALSRLHGNFSCAPNFAYELCATQGTEQDRKDLDLSNWEFAGCGAEPISKETIDRFVEVYRPYGFRPDAFTTGYGLTEATLAVSCSLKKSGPRALQIDRKSLYANQVRETTSNGKGGLSVVSSGRPVPESVVLIVKPESLNPAAPNQIGEVWVSGPGIALGYWDRPEETEQTFHARLADVKSPFFLRTGDLGFQKDGELFIVGRIKDLMVIRGKNHYAEDIEQTIERKCHNLRQKSNAAFSVLLEGKERLVVTQEIDNITQSEVESLATSIRQVVAEEHGLHVYSIVFLKPGSLPRTPGRKIQRYLCKEGFLNGSLQTFYTWKKKGSAKKIASPSGSLEQWLISQVAEKLGMDPEEIDLREALTNYEVDSLTSVELSGLIQSKFDIIVEPVTFLQGFNIHQVAEKIRQEQQNNTARQIH